MAVIIRYKLSELLRKIRVKILPNTSKLKVKQYKYLNYSEYVKIQTFFNKKKIDKIWADQNILNFIIKDVRENFPKNDYSYKQLFNFSKKIFKKKEKSFLDYCDYSFDFIKFMYDIKERRKLCDFLNTSITERSEKYLKHYIKCSETLTKCLK